MGQIKRLSLSLMPGAVTPFAPHLHATAPRGTFKVSHRKEIKFTYYLFPTIVNYKSSIRNSVDFCYFAQPFCHKKF